MHEFIAALRQLQRPLVLLAVAILVVQTLVAGLASAHAAARIATFGADAGVICHGNGDDGSTPAGTPAAHDCCAFCNNPGPVALSAGAPVIDRLTPAHRTRAGRSLPAMSGRAGARSAPDLRKRLRLPPEPALTARGLAARRPRFTWTSGEFSMVRKFVIGAAGALACLSAVSAPTSAHVTLERQEAPVGASYKAVLRVPHGCGGSPTTAIRVRLPAGIIGVKPMPKPGWQLNAVTGKYPKPYTLRGAQVTEGVTEIAWSGGKLPDAHYDEFVFIGVIAEELGGRPDDLFPGRAGMREGRASLDRDPDRQAFRRARRGQRRAGGGAAPAAEAEVVRARVPHSWSRC